MPAFDQELATKIFDFLVFKNPDGLENICDEHFSIMMNTLMSVVIGIIKERYCLEDNDAHLLMEKTFKLMDEFISINHNL